MFSLLYPHTSIFKGLLHFCNYLPLKKGIPRHLNKLESPPPKDYLCQVWLKLAQWFFRRRFLNDSTPFLHFCAYLPLEEDMVLYLNKFESSSPEDNLCQIWLNLACWFWRRFLNVFNGFLLFCYHLPLEKGFPIHSNKLESPPPKNELCQFGLKLAQRFWRRSRKCKSLHTDARTDGRYDGQQMIWIVHLSFQLRWAKNVSV
jgi:hypothetical protein